MMKSYYLLCFCILTIFFNTNALATCDDTLPIKGVRDDVLIIVNDNAKDSCEVGRYYAEQRNLGQYNIAHTFTRPSHLLHYNEFLNFSDQIIKYMQDNTLIAGAPPAPDCTDGLSPYYCQASTDHLRQYTKIRYLVPTLGVPMRTRVLTNTESTTVDNYIAFSLLRYIDVTTLFTFNEREIAFTDGRGMRTIDPQHDGELIVGRIDGVSLESTKRIIDRTIDAERNGLYGKLYGSYFGLVGSKAQWLDYSRTDTYGDFVTVYGNKTSGLNGNSWRYQLGLFGESRPECVDYIGSNLKAPLDCNVRFSLSPPGTENSRTPTVPDALMYLGALHGQKSGGGSFDAVLNYERNQGCSPKLCRNHVDPAACKATSTDELKEINTQCVGVANGFIGYNFQSYPVASMALWPTGYESSSSGSTNLEMLYPKVRNTIGFDDNSSLWFSNNDSVVNPNCYNTSDFSTAPADICRMGRTIEMYPVTPIVMQNFDPLNPQTYQIRFHVMANNIKANTKIIVNLRVRSTYGFDLSGNNIWKDYGLITAVTLPTGNTNWTPVSLDIPLDAFLQSGTDITYDTLQFHVTSSAFEGEIGIDKFTIVEATSNTLLTSNADFTQGHEQVSSGDHAAMFMNRLNAVGYWGSVSHYGSGGQSFGNNSMEAIIYFLRGLPLGDAIWWGESLKSGIYYGDPLYSPTAVRFDYINDNSASVKDSISGHFELKGSTVNGRDQNLVTTNYSIEYCPGADFFYCDQTNNWLSTGLTGTGGQENMSLGVWNSSQVDSGAYVLRLSVSSVNDTKNRSQILYDYYPVMVYKAGEDYDGDGVNNETELTNGTDPGNVFEPNSEGMNVYLDDKHHKPSKQFDSNDTLYILTWNQTLGAGINNSNTSYSVSGDGKKINGSLDDLSDGRYSASISLKTLGYTGDNIIATTQLQLNKIKFDKQKSITILPGGNNPPTLTINSPIHGAEHNPKKAINFSATAFDIEDNDITSQITWTSSTDGILGTGGELLVQLINDGEHIIRTEVTDNEGKKSFNEMTIYNGQKPIPLTVSLDSYKGDKAIKLEWSGLTHPTTNVIRNNILIATLETTRSGSGSYVDISASIASGSSYQYIVCGGRSQCSEPSAFTVP